VGDTLGETSTYLVSPTLSSGGNRGVILSIHATGKSLKSLQIDGVFLSVVIFEDLSECPVGIETEKKDLVALIVTFQCLLILEILTSLPLQYIEGIQEE
jgi:hypothetical protein